MSAARRKQASNAQADARRNADLKREHREGLHQAPMPGSRACYTHVPSAAELNAQIRR